MRRTVSAIAIAAAIGIGSAAAAAPALAVTPARAAACSTTWGTNAKHHGNGSTVPTPVRQVRAGRHACFDRLVIELGAGPAPSFSAKYVAHIIADGSGAVLRVRGHARILVTVQGPAGRHYRPNAVNLVSVAGFGTFRQVRGAGSFERVTSLGLGVRARLPFRAFLLGSTSGWRLVVDVAH